MIPLAFTVLAVGGVLGRWQLSLLNRPGWPGATLAINVVASLALGLLADSTESTMTLAGVALLGSFSTFSTVIRELTELSGTNRRRWAAGYLAATLTLGLGAALIGLEVASRT